MKKLFLSLIIILLVYFNTIPASVYKDNKTFAEEPSFFMRVINEETALYKDRACSQLLFYLPYTYYVKILSFNDYSIYVECYIDSTTPSIDGYVLKDCLFNDYTTPEKPYVNLTLKTIATAVLYQDLSLSVSISYIFENRNLTFYGRATDSVGNYYYFVSYNSKLGYVKESAIQPFVIENHPNPLTFIPPEPQPDTPTGNQAQEGNANGILTLKVVIIVCLFFAVIVALFIAFKKREPVSKRVYYDDNDYE